MCQRFRCSSCLARIDYNSALRQYWEIKETYYRRARCAVGEGVAAKETEMARLANQQAINWNVNVAIWTLKCQLYTTIYHKSAHKERRAN